MVLDFLLSVLDDAMVSGVHISHSPGTGLTLSSLLSRSSSSRCLPSHVLLSGLSLAAAAGGSPAAGFPAAALADAAAPAAAPPVPAAPRPPHTAARPALTAPPAPRSRWVN